jgi:hypothetical protein
MTVLISPVARQQFLDNSGNPLVGGKLFTYAKNSTVKQSTYTDSTGTIPNTNPIILDASGRTPNGLWLTSGVDYKFVVTNSTDTDPPSSPIYTEDNIQGSSGNTITTTDQWNVSALTPSYISANSFSFSGDTTVTYHVGRRIKALVSSGYIYGTITNSAFSTGTTTVTVLTDTGILDSGLSRVDLGILTYNNHSVPNVYAPVIFGKNLIINPAFSINQRSVTGTVVLAAGVYGHDRWKAGASGCTYTFTTVNGLTTLTITAGSLIQVVESVNVPYGINTHTLSWTGTAQGKIGTGNYSTSGVTELVTGGANINVEFNTGTLTLVQFEKSNFPTSFEQRPYNIELQFCQRYYWKGFARAGGTTGASSSLSECFISFQTSMRAVPTLTKVGADALVNCSSATADSPAVNGFRYYVQSITGPANYSATNPDIRAAAEL